jgi:hypothetical protein
VVQGRRAKDTDDSEYLPGDQVQGDTDDDAELDEEPVPLMVIEVQRDGGCTVACFTTKLAFPYISHVFLLLQAPHSTSTEDMPPGGARPSKRVATSPPNERLAEDIPTDRATQAKRARQHTSNERPRGVNTRSSTRQQPTETVDQESPPVAEEENGLARSKRVRA